MLVPLNEKEKSILLKIVGRFLNQSLGTPIQRIRKNLGSKRSILDRLVKVGYIKLSGNIYLPTFYGIEQLDDDIRDIARKNLNIVFTAIRNLYMREDQHVFNASEVICETKRLNPVLDEEEIHIALILSLDFGFFDGHLGHFSTENKLTMDQISVLEKIIDFKTVAKEWEQIKQQKYEAKKRLTSFRPSHPTLTSNVELPTINFSFVENRTLLQIITRDYRELQILQGTNALKSRLILAGSLIEALLLDALQRDTKKAQACQKSATGSIEEWGLATIIDVADELGLISAAAQTHGHAVREYRNLVHPGKELRSNYILKEEEIAISEKVLEIVIRDLQERK